VIGKPQVIAAIAFRWAMRDSNPRLPACEAGRHGTSISAYYIVMQGLTTWIFADNVFQEFTGFSFFFNGLSPILCHGRQLSDDAFDTT
jgi:hypothetical protein